MEGHRTSLLKSPIILAVCAALLAAAPAAAEPASAYNGDWTAAPSAGGQTLRLVLHLKTGGGAQTTELDSVDLGATIPVAAPTVGNCRCCSWRSAAS